MRIVNGAVAPFLKWTGGKRQILPIIKKYVPEHMRYFEPFLGGGAVFFALRPKIAFLNDLNSDLINVYEVIKEFPGELIESLKQHKNEEEYFYDMRRLDRDYKRYNSLDSIKKASRFIYLNKTCFNGLFRVNKKGQFNAPYGRYINPNIVCEPLLRAVTDYLNTNELYFTSFDFTDHLKAARKGDFVYLDPPYDPVSTTSHFTGYVKYGFDKDDQLRLKQTCDVLAAKGVKFLLSNSATTYIKTLYQDYDIVYVYANRVINSNAKKRGSICELLIKNY
ncbi:MAG: DNA adenine methylase [Firmicutes bacterium]|nr:DNA adenine methylase [Bacillota bacterium]MDD4262964.1 DNA adenine methylase [Bacillota bacterium]